MLRPFLTIIRKTDTLSKPRPLQAPGELHRMFKLKSPNSALFEATRPAGVAAYTTNHIRALMWGLLAFVTLALLSFSLKS